jgi:hypothetical protein
LESSSFIKKDCVDDKKVLDDTKNIINMLNGLSIQYDIDNNHNIKLIFT